MRYDGGHKRSSLCHERLQGLFSLEGICPEVAIGMGVPRAPIRLVGDPSHPRAVRRDDPVDDVTDRLAEFARATSRRLDGVSGYIFIERSPSCGLYGVEVAGDAAAPRTVGRGIYAAALTRILPNLPVEESARLEDDARREAFVARVFVYAHWQRFVAQGTTAAGLVAFHSRYKNLLIAHGVPQYREAERLVANPSGDLAATAEAYFTLLMTALATPPVISVASVDSADAGRLP